MSNIAQLLHEEMLHFIDRIEDILDTHHLDSDDIVFVKFIFKKMSDSYLMNHVIKHILPWKGQIVKRDMTFFYDNKEIFGKLPQEKVNYFADIVKSNKLDEDDINEIWDFFDAFVAYAEQFKKNN